MSLSNKYPSLDSAMKHLLYLNDSYIRFIDKDRDAYLCGRADAIGQVIIDLCEELNAVDTEAYKRVMEFESVELYKTKYPIPIESTYANR